MTTVPLCRIELFIFNKLVLLNKLNAIHSNLPYQQMNDNDNDELIDGSHDYHFYYLINGVRMYKMMIFR